MKTLLLISAALIININCYAKKYSLSIYQGHYFIQLTVNDKPALFIIDSGSTKSIFDTSKDSIYGFKYVEFGNQQYAGIGGNSQIYMIYDYNITEFQHPFLGVNISKLTAMFNCHLPVAGILGSDFLFKFKAVLDYGNNTIEF